MSPLLQRLQQEVARRKRPGEGRAPRLRRWGVAIIAVLIAFELGARTNDTPARWVVRQEVTERVRGLHRDVESLQGEVQLQRAYIERLERIHRYSAGFGISAELAAAIEDIARSEGVDVDLAFNLVRVESRFNQRAISPVGAVGFTQVMPATARILSPGISYEELFDRDTNLRLGFRFYREMLERYDGNVRLALLAYNRGPTTVDRLLAEGRDPNNGYPRLVLRR
jgi:soluble lytic murein transglycosylase-like protein